MRDPESPVTVAMPKHQFVTPADETKSIHRFGYRRLFQQLREVELVDEDPARQIPPAAVA